MPLGKDIFIMEEAVTGKKEELYGPTLSTTEGIAASQDDGTMI